jgi:hypothetical protein
MGPDARNDKPSGRDDVVDAATVRGGLEARLDLLPRIRTADCPRSRLTYLKSQYKLYIK